MPKQTFRLCVAGITTLALASVCWWAAPLRAETPGEAVYKAKCASCHGADGKGETPVGKMYKLRDLGSADVQKQTDAELTDIISKGKNKMPGYGRSLKDDEIKSLVGYLRALAKK